MAEDKTEGSAVGIRLGELLRQKGIEDTESAGYEARVRYLEQENETLIQENAALAEEKSLWEKEKAHLLQGQKRLIKEKRSLEQEKDTLSEKLARREEDIQKLQNTNHSLPVTLFENAIQNLKKENFVDAMGLLQAVLIHEPGNIKAMINLAVAYSALGYPERAEKTLREVLEQSPDNEVAKRNLEILMEA
ncbi:MAG: hypothetical protein B6245_14575 [Desulfobacteraceae bacterium 4572_88]|nr:MAG: hypothetical protein B6245_14575 [Desulfobacteraceae bacterium 4572_88]